MDRRPFASLCRAFFALAAALAFIASTPTSAHAQSASYKKQFPLERSPDDVTFTKRGLVAVVRASEHYPDQIQGPQPSIDQVVVVNPVDGTRIPILTANACAPFALTEPTHAADLVAASEDRAVLIGQRHWTTGAIAGQYTSVNVLDLTDAYGATGPVCLKSWSKAEAGFVSDVDITPDGRFAVVNHRGSISVFRIDGATVPDPVEFSTSGANPTSQKNSIAMSRIEIPGAPVKCVVTTVRDIGGTKRLWAYVLDLAGATPVLDASLAINASNPGESNPGHDLRMTPDETMAVVSADGVVALIDLTVSPAVIRGELSDVNAERSYVNLADSVVLTNTQAVVLSSHRGHPSGQWRADVFDLSSGATGSLTLKQSETGASYPHDLARSNDRQTVVIRTQDHIVILDDIHKATVKRVNLSSPSGPFANAVLSHDSVVVSRAWVNHVLAGQPGGGPRHYAAVLGNLIQSPPATRVDIVDLTPLWSTPPQDPFIVLTEVLTDPAYTLVAAASIQLHPGGQSFVVRCNAAPHDIDPENPPVGYDPATGEDVWYFSLHDVPGSSGPTPIGSVFQYEMTASPRSVSDPLDVARYRAVNISSHYSQFQGDHGYVHTIKIDE